MQAVNEDDRRLLYVTSDPGQNSADEFHDWYDNEHVANRLPFDGLSNATRWRAIDDERPEWLATYDVTQSLLDDSAYQRLRTHRSPREREVIERLGDFTRSTYLHKAESGKPSLQVRSAGTHLLSVRLYSELDHQQKIIDWYIGEHIPRLLSIDSWLRIRVFVATDSRSNQTHVLALHDLSSLSGFEAEEYQLATSTPWRREVMRHVSSKDRRLYSMHRRF